MARNTNMHGRLAAESVCVCDHMATDDTPMLPQQPGSLSFVATDITRPVTNTLHLSCVSKHQLRCDGVLQPAASEDD